MKTVLVIFGVILLTSAGVTAATVGCGFSSPIAITPGLVVECGDDTFDFGAKPLPLGGSVTLKSMILVRIFHGDFGFGTPYYEWDLDFGFPNPSIRTTEVDFSVLYAGVMNNPYGSAAEYFGLGLSPSPFGTMPPNDALNSPNESGSDFLITESLGGPSTLKICGGNGFAPCDSSIRNLEGIANGGQSFGVVTTITDKAGDLTGFDEGFQTPEPASWMLLAGGLLAVRIMRRGRGRR